VKNIPEYYKTKHVFRLVVGGIFVLLVLIIVLSFFTTQKMIKIIRNDFNTQQLYLANHAAAIIDKDFDILKSELLTLSLSPSIQYIESVSWRNRMEISMATIREYGVFRILLITAKGRSAYIVEDKGSVFQQDTDYSQSDFFIWCRDPNNHSKVYASSIDRKTANDSKAELHIKLATPVYQESPDEAHPLPTQKFTGVLVFLIKANQMAGRTIAPLRSGKTGYAWVIDQEGYFIYHLEHQFIGKNAFEARHLENPHISFDQINKIQQEKMLIGKQGTSWYSSGWHRGNKGPVHKLIAFAPAHMGADNFDHFWSVAVVAPISEVQDEIQSIYLRQALIQITFILVAAAIFFILRYYELIWVKDHVNQIHCESRELEEYARRLEDSEKRYRTLIESADDLIFVLDRKCHVMSMNQSWTRMTGQPAKSIIGKRLEDILKYDNGIRVNTFVEDAISQRYAISHDDPVVVNGNSYWFNTRYKRITEFDDQYEAKEQAVLVIARDITERKQLESYLLNAQKMSALGELCAGVAHEINNPLAIILGFTEMLLEKAASGTREHKILSTIERQGENCKQIVEKLLIFARIPAESTTSADVSLNLQRVLDVVSNTLLTEKIRLSIEIPDLLPKVRGDSQELEQVFLNIINNAISAMKDGGFLKVTAEHVLNEVHIHFEDTGTGIAPENFSRIFDPFFTTKEVGEGTGLGLAVSYSIIKKIGGEILVKNRIASDTQESGTTFSLHLPVAENRSTGIQMIAQPGDDYE